MAEAPQPVSLATARATIAGCILGSEPSQLRIGDIALHAHQRSAVVRIRQILIDHGGALLCDDVGLGKTYVALAVAASYDSVAVIAPATLADMWRRALAVTDVTARFVSVESLGRNGAPNDRCALIIVDEAHHFRNSSTRRYAALARMCMLAPVLLLTATPLHNSRDDVSAMIALFRGSRAYSMSDAGFASMIIRRGADDGAALHGIPAVEHAPPCVLPSDETVLDRILALPAPVPPSDGSVATRLVMHGLVRQWVSSNAALIGALKRRIGRSHGLLASLEAGRYPTAAELSAWVYAGDAVQLAFAELLVPATTPLAALTSALRDHVSALSELLAFVRDLGDESHARFVREVRATHPTEKIVVFSCYAETAEAVYRSLMRDGHAALLTAGGARIASGPASRAAVMSQFAPATNGNVAVAAHEVIDLLVATDLLSEGVDLQEASIVIHLDVPWTRARIDQRIGRLARMGSRHQRVLSYSVNPPPRAENFLHELEIVARKSGFSSRLFGDTRDRCDTDQPASAATITRAETARAIMGTWCSDASDSRDTLGPPRVAYALGPRCAAIGSWMVDGVPTLLAWDDGGGIRTDPASVEVGVRMADTATDAVHVTNGAVRSSLVIQAAEAWYQQRCAWLAVGGVDGSASQPVVQDARRLLSRVADTTSSNAGFARRTRSAAIAARLRRVAASPLPLAVEWSLESLAESPDDASVNTILDLVDRARSDTDGMRERGFRCVALILFTEQENR